MIDKAWIPVMMALVGVGGITLSENQTLKTTNIDTARLYVDVLNDQLTVIESLNDRVKELTIEVSSCYQQARTSSFSKFATE